LEQEKSTSYKTGMKSSYYTGGRGEFGGWNNKGKESGEKEQSIGNRKDDVDYKNNRDSA